MGKGRKKLPDSIKIMKGTNQKCRMETPVNENLLPAKINYVPKPPDWFSPLGVNLYNDVTSELLAKKLIEKVDMSMVIAFCNQMALHLELEQYLKERGSRIDEMVEKIYRNGKPAKVTRRLCPEHRASMDALEKAKQIATEFGFTPLARQRLVYQAINNNPSDDDFT
jgi:P27 family predicted phage terminase small subunit